MTAIFTTGIQACQVSQVSVDVLGKDGIKTYSAGVNIPPQSTNSISIKMVSGNNDSKSWRISGGKGQ